MWELWDQISTLGKYRATSIVRDKIWKRYIWYSQLDQLLPTVLSSSPRERNIFSDRGNLQVFRVRCVLQISHPAVYSKSLHKGAMRQLKTNKYKIQWKNRWGSSLEVSLISGTKKWRVAICFPLRKILIFPRFAPWNPRFLPQGFQPKKADSKGSKFRLQKLRIHGKNQGPGCAG